GEGFPVEPGGHGDGDGDLDDERGEAAEEGAEAGFARFEEVAAGGELAQDSPHGRSEENPYQRREDKRAEDAAEDGSERAATRTAEFLRSIVAGDEVQQLAQGGQRKGDTHKFPAQPLRDPELVDEDACPGDDRPRQDGDER